MRRRSIGAVLVAVGLLGGLASCGSGESKEQKALNQVCDARADIQKQVNELSSLTASTATVDGIKSSVSAIGSDLTKIKDATPQLNEQRKKEVQSATQAFEGEVSSTINGLTSTTSLSQAGSQIQSSAQKLAQSFKQALAPISCS